MGFFANPISVQAGWAEFFGFGGNNDGTSQQSNGDIELKKQIRRVERDQNFHDSLEVRSGESIEVRIEVKNESSKVANTIIKDELGGSVVYTKNSLKINGQLPQGNIFAEGIQINIPSKSKTQILYRFNVCGANGVITRASAYSAGIGSAVDGVYIEMENQNSNYFYDDTSTCLTQFQTSNTTQSYSGVNNLTSTNTSNNPFAGWSGVNNSSNINSAINNPFAGWTGVSNSSTSTPASYNPFAGWTGVNNSNNVNSNTNNPFGDWTGVSSNSTSTSTNPFDGWTGVNNSNNVNSNTNNPFGDWAGVNNSDGSYASSNSTFGDWAGNTSTNTVSNNDPFGNWAGASNSNSTSQTTSSNNKSTYFVSPMTGVNRWAPFGFAGLLTAGFMMFRMRKQIFT